MSQPLGNAGSDQSPPPTFPGRITVLGPGGVGGLLAGLLARDGREVTVVATESTAAHIASEGLRVDSAVFGDFTAEVEAVSQATAPTDVLVVGCKATSLDAALRRVPAECVSGALVLPLLNGLEHMAVLRSCYPGAHVPAAAIRVESTRVAPGRIVQSSPFTMLDIACSGVPAERVEALAEAVRTTGFSVQVHDGENAENTVLWTKLHVLLPMALVCAHSGLPVEGARTTRRDDLAGVAGEVADTAVRLGVRLDTAGVLAMVDAIPGRTKPSMLRDREAGRPMEVDALGGALLRAARRVGADTPVAARIVAELERVDRASAPATS
ncbi:ketopantoate reductase family protein [Allosalinactinospora lopnorensis]|uniref:ketopantoate reductase family protein n=1 Tax=Allosalinactinospora lopnorensis TaxID=1352348 RepID=UPI000623E54B|nr:2-dehydropantoate 2-reductase [Allosalinactinospora lopnorensis]